MHVLIAFPIITERELSGVSAIGSLFLDAIFGLLLWFPPGDIHGNIRECPVGAKAFLFAFISAILSRSNSFYALSHGELAVTATVLAIQFTQSFSPEYSITRDSFLLVTFVRISLF